MKLRALRWLFVAVVGAFFVRVAVRNADQLRDVDLSVEPLWFLAAAPFTFAGGWLLPLAWSRLVEAYGAHLSPFEAVRIWSLAATSRYIPSGLVAVASRVVLAAKAGVPRPVGAATSVVELAIVVAWGAALAGLLLPSDVLAAPLRALLAGGAVAGVALLPFLLRHARRVPGLADASADTSTLYEAVGLYLANAAVKGVGFVLFAAALLPVDAGDAPLLIGAVNAAAILGMIGVTPAGLGVREGFVTAFLRQDFGLGDAAALAVALRVWDLVFELIWLATIAAVPRIRNGSTAPTR